LPTIKVNTSKLGSYESELQSVLSRVNSINSQFFSVSRNLDWDIKAASNISSRMSAIERELSAESRGISGMKNYLGSARTKYDQVDQATKRKQNDGLHTGAEGGLEGSVLGYEAKTSAGANWDSKKGEAGANWKASLEGYAAKGKVSGSYGLASGSISGTVGSVAASGEMGATLMKNGKFAPSLDAQAKASATAAKGDVKAQFGSDDNNVHVEASGELATAEAKASAKIGKIEYEDAKENKKTGWGAEAEVGAEAYLAKGSISGGLSIFGIAIDTDIEGKAGGAGGKAGGGATSSSVTGEIGLGLLVGLGAKVKVDWSNCTLLKRKKKGGK